VVTQDGRQAEMLVHSMPIYDGDGKIDRVMEVSTNITEVKRLQRELGMVGAAVAGMTHRMKNILTGLEGGIFVVNTGFEMGDDSMVDDGWDMVKRNVAKVSRIAKDLLYCAKEREPAPKEGVCPASILADVHELYRDRAKAEGIELSLDLPDEPHTGCYDEDGLHSLVLNLTANAVDACRFDTATNKKHKIVLRCNEDADANTVIEVEDNGGGIADDVSHKVFRGFFSVKGTEGTGIGLLVVQKVAEEHGGSVSFSTREGEGTTFRVVLPPLDPPASALSA
jgi:signal transduction histidine kinase